ncbi:uncharacterized protein [Aegilops tauschii subsp. strangulata]|uniref:uncharacterized protein isoform X3 n=1 Tax=Aegilops tauschii subsp. strangulata TaxID=200361 RepID=UPI003CC852AC
MATAGLPDPCLLAPTSSLRSRSTPPGELGKGVWGYWELGAWKPLGISGRQRARLRKEVLLAGEDWAYDPPRGEMRTKRKGNKVDCIAAEKRANTVELMKKMPQMLLDYKRLQLRLLVVCTGCRARGCRWPRGRRPGSRRTRVCRRRTTGPSAWSSLTRSSTASSASSPRRSDGTTLTPSGPGSLVLAGSAKSEAKVVLFDPGTVVEMDEEGCWLEDPEPSQLLCLTVPLPCLPEWPNF